MKKAIILLSGGLDSATLLAIAKDQGFACYALSIDYGQRHRVELTAATKLAASFQVAEHRIVKMAIGDWGGSALTDTSLAMPCETSNDIPITYVPARNTIFLSTALAWAEVIGASDIFFGANRVDGPNYPDCRPEYFDAFAKMANLATRVGVEGAAIRIHTPLIDLTKADIIRQGLALGVDFALTISCYNPSPTGEICGTCVACQIRSRGFAEVN